MMVACLPCTPEVLPKRSPLTSCRQTKFSSQEAPTLLRNCTTFNHLKQIHAKIFRSSLSQDQLIIRRLIQLCSFHGKMDYATLVFHQIQGHLTFTWNLMIKSYTTNGCSQQALLLYSHMIRHGVPPDKFTFPFVIKACISSTALEQGRAVHGLVIKNSFSRDIFVQNTLMDLYFKCGEIGCGCRVFDKMRVRNVVSWTTMISGLVACGKLHAARGVFERMPAKNVVSWTAMISGYVNNQQPEEAFELFRRMQLGNVRPNEFTLVSLLKACTHFQSLKLARRIHDFALKNGFKIYVYLGTALIDTYSKCGSLEEAKRVFDKMQNKSLATWNSMITSLGVHGFGEEALTVFAQMEEANVWPDAITFVGVLSASWHTNNLEEGCKHFSCMSEHYGITPILEHYTCMIELYSRADMFDEVSKLLKAMPVKPERTEECPF